MELSSSRTAGLPDEDVEEQQCKCLKGNYILKIKRSIEVKEIHEAQMYCILESLHKCFGGMHAKWKVASLHAVQERGKILF